MPSSARRCSSFAALVVAVLWLVASSEHRDQRSYRIYFARQSLEGLQVRSEVRMKGIRVGDVSAFAFAPNRPGTVEVEISLEPSTPVRHSTLAVVERNLVTGLATVRLVNPTEDSPLLTEPPPGEPLPVIAEGASQLQQVSESLNLLAARADETLRRINTTLSDENQVAIAQTLAGLRDLTHEASAA
jgi:phospholipid/cholesterol/gamma-HCH transport system substrate-binding protein